MLEERRIGSGGNKVSIQNQMRQSRTEEFNQDSKGPGSILSMVSLANKENQRRTGDFGGESEMCQIS